MMQQGHIEKSMCLFCAQILAEQIVSQNEIGYEVLEIWVQN